MGIQDFRAELAGSVPGAEGLLMRYDEGGKVQVFFIGEQVVRVSPSATPADVKEAFLKL